MKEDAPTTEPIDEVLPDTEPRRHDDRVRSFRITERLLERYGRTPGCIGCEHIPSGAPGDHRGHTAECRQRIREAMIQDEDHRTTGLEADRRLEINTDKPLQTALEEAHTDVNMEVLQQQIEADGIPHLLQEDLGGRMTPMLI